jgi:hypothetical protein
MTSISQQMPKLDVCRVSSFDVNNEMQTKYELCDIGVLGTWGRPSSPQNFERRVAQTLAQGFPPARSQLGFEQTAEAPLRMLLKPS